LLAAEIPVRTRVDDQQMTAGILFNFVDQIARVAETVREPGIAADHHQQVAMLNIFGRMSGLRTKEKAIDPEVAGLFLREGVVVIG
jgi:hypothetical protein